MPESAYERARKHSGSNDWGYGEKYNTAGEFNPRMSACTDCGEYKEPEELSLPAFGGILCRDCKHFNAQYQKQTEANPEIVERRSGGYPTI
ncbi:hypothetical protein UFOVP325_70 [uncultured Caudovirales phage]|uniref:Uncharacterized protein n=1 Tax=uncultured Caudovirales phage TaxID=2100421 RepID=A0A6J5LT35_9CAUD|nr:hypothetical protein UFOVP325_70 [uncultured Caudovirales phage]CAB4147987.1 hypothetical protein UFOVP430_65 [uncultured Caudovirales phage]